jgi:hypothetical protein
MAILLYFFGSEVNLAYLHCKILSFVLGLCQILIIFLLIKDKLSAMVHTCNPSYLGGRDWKECGSSPVWVKICQESISTTKNYGGFCSSSIEFILQ